MMNIDKDIGDNPTPQQVKDYYDLHTGEGAANFSNEDAGITVQLWHSLAQALEENERLREDADKMRSLIVDCPECYRTLLGMVNALKE